MSTNRATVKTGLVNSLSTKLGSTAKTVTGNKVDDIAALTPLVAVLSTGSKRERLTFQGSRASFTFEIQVWVRQKDDAWTNPDAEDVLDGLEVLVHDALAESSVKADYTGTTSVTEVTVSGIAYYVERIPIIAEMSGG